MSMFAWNRPEGKNQHDVITNANTSSGINFIFVEKVREIVLNLTNAPVSAILC